MPILARETNLYPHDLLERGASGDLTQGRWWAMYTRSRREKKLMRSLLTMQVPFYGPMISRRHRSPGGRLQVSYQPLFSNYVFVYDDAAHRERVLATNCISRCLPVHDGTGLAHDLFQVQKLIEAGEPLAPESRLIEGHHVRVKNGLFAGFEGVVIRRQNETRLLVAVNFMQQGVSVLLHDCQLERLS